MVSYLEERSESVQGSRGRPVPRETLMIDAVEEALTRSDEVQGIAVCSREGLPIVDGFSGPHDATTVAAMAELIRRSGTKVFENLGYEGPEYLVLHGKDAEVLVHAVPPYATLIAVADANANIGLVHLVLRDLARRLTELFEG